MVWARVGACASQVALVTDGKTRGGTGLRALEWVPMPARWRLSRTARWRVTWEGRVVRA